MSLTTPSKIRELQIKLYRKAKNEPGYCFYMLYDKVYREDILLHAYERARANKGAPGVDGQTFEQIESAGLAEWLTGIREELRNKTYKPQPVRRVMIPKPGGGERPLGIPTIRDRVIQTAVKLLIEPIFEADFEPNAYGYRPKRSAQDAIQEVHGIADALPHELAMRSGVRRTRFRKCMSCFVKATPMWWTRHDSALLVTAMCGAEDRRQAHAASAEDVVESAGRGKG
jgi:hypothetical protein